MSVLRDYAGAVAQPTLAGGQPRYDEVVGPDGSLRPAWKGLAETVVSLTPRDLRRVDGDVSAMLADDGVPAGWQLDPVPLVVDAAAWAPLEVGLAQRGELLNALLVDLYGERRLLREGVVPPAAVLGHAGYTRVVARPGAVDPRPLVLAATDLGRDAEGRWHVLADRTQAPSGLGLAMESRRVTSRVLPELYREAGLHRIEPYFSALRSALLQSAQGDLADPRVVVLSPGSHAPTAYDQAFVASVLGFPLVQGSDLVVRDGWVMLRAAGGGGRLERVDVILRRVDTAWSDPLELRGDSRLGVAGLVEAVRRGRVRVVNGLGAGVLENPALMAFLPAVCEALLGEQLRLPSVRTWWCGDPDSLDHVLSRSDRLLVRPVDGPPLPAAAGRREVESRVLAEPHRWVGQERLPLSQAPTWGAEGRTTGRVTPAALSLRAFTLRYGSAYRPLVGGLATVVDGVAVDELADEGRASATKDVWVLKAAPHDPDQGLAEVLPVTSTPAVSVLSPRVLEDLFWFGRYAERAEDALRLVLTVHAYVEDYRTRPRSSGGASTAVLLGAVRRLAGDGSPDADEEFRSLLLDTAREGSAAHALARWREVLQGVRDQFSLDTWRGFGTVDRARAALRVERHSHQVAESGGRMLTGVLAVHGVTASMVRDAGWHVLEAGRHLERALQVCHLLAATTTERRGIDVDREVLLGVLTATESVVTHRRRYRGSVRPAGVLELLLLDTANPRSLAFSLDALRVHLAAQPHSTGSTRAERLLAELRESVDATDVATLVAIGGVGRPYLQRFLDETARALARLAEAVHEVHFASGPAPRPLAAVATTEVRA